MRIDKKHQVVEEARTWLGTPFVHQGRQKGVGCDCAAIIVRVAKMVGMEANDLKGYGRSPNAGRLQQCLRTQLHEIPIDAAVPGDVLLMRFFGDPQHIAIVTDLGIIHSYSRVSRKKAECGCVVEHRLNRVWKSRICAAFEFPGLRV